MLNGAYTLLDYDGSPKPTLPALAQAIAMLGDATEPADLSNPALRAYVFRRLGAAQGSRFVAVAWARVRSPFLSSRRVRGRCGCWTRWPRPCRAR